MKTDDVLLVGIIAGLLQLVGYLVYYQKTIRGSLEPNPLTWLMFAYGTMILFVLELDQGATLSELILPAVCSTCAVGVAARVWIIAYRKEGKIWPRTWRIERSWEGRSFAADLALTVAYLGAWALALSSWLTESERLIASLVFLFLSNATTFTAFLPVLKQAWSAPRTEQWIPWAIWTISYSLLIWVTANSTDAMFPTHLDVAEWTYESWTLVALMIYPVSNAALHGLVGVFASPRRQQRSTQATPQIN